MKYIELENLPRGIMNEIARFPELTARMFEIQWMHNNGLWREWHVFYRDDKDPIRKAVDDSVPSAIDAIHAAAEAKGIGRWDGNGRFVRVPQYGDAPA